MVSTFSNPCNSSSSWSDALALLIKSCFNFHQVSIMRTIFLVLKWVLINWAEMGIARQCNDHTMDQSKTTLCGIIRQSWLSSGHPFWPQNIFFWVENLKHHNLYLVINNNLIDYYRYRLINEIESNSCHKIVVYETFFLDGSCITEFFFSKLCLVLLLYGFHIHIKLLFIWHTRLWLGLF